MTNVCVHLTLLSLMTLVSQMGTVNFYTQNTNFLVVLFEKHYAFALDDDFKNAEVENRLYYNVAIK